jgi:hypothetical protein
VEIAVLLNWEAISGGWAANYPAGRVNPRQGGWRPGRDKKNILFAHTVTPLKPVFY